MVFNVSEHFKRFAAYVSFNISWWLKGRRIYPFTVVNNSKISKGVVIGMFSKVTDSMLEDNIIINKYCNIYNSILEKKVKIGIGNIIAHSYIGMLSYTSYYTTIYASKIGNYCSISANCYIGAQYGEHNPNAFTTAPLRWHLGIFKKPNKYIAYIGNDVWIGANAVIREGVRIGDGAIIGAGAVVTKDIPDYAIAVGVPAKVIKYRFDKEIIKRIIKTKWWEFDINTLKKYNLIDLLTSDVDDEKLSMIEEKVDKIRRNEI